MNDKSNILWIALSLVFVIAFNTIVFLTTDTFTLTFWVSYGFIHFAYFMLVIAISRMPKVKNVFVLGYPMIYLSYVYFISAFIIGVIFIIYKTASLNLAVIPQIIIAGLFSFLYISNILANESTIASEKKSQNDIFYIKNAAMEISQLMNQSNDALLNKKLEKLYDLIRSSQVKSHSALSDVENNIMVKIEELKNKVNSKDYAAASLIIDFISNLIVERNSKIAVMR